MSEFGNIYLPEEMTFWIFHILVAEDSTQDFELVQPTDASLLVVDPCSSLQFFSTLQPQLTLDFTLDPPIQREG